MRYFMVYRFFPHSFLGHVFLVEVYTRNIYIYTKVLLIKKEAEKNRSTHPTLP